MKENNFDAIDERVDEMQILYEEVMQDNQEYRKFIRGFKEKRNRLDLLTKYYSGYWQKDRDEVHEKNHEKKDYEVLSDDPIFNAIEEQIKLMKELTDLLNQY